MFPAFTLVPSNNSYRTSHVQFFYRTSMVVQRVLNDRNPAET